MNKTSLQRTRNASYCFFFSLQPRPPKSTLFPYTTLFRSHKQMDNRIKLLEEILSFRMQGVEKRQNLFQELDRKSDSAGMPRPISYAVFCLKKKKHGILHRPSFGSAPSRHRSMLRVCGTTP